MKILKKKKELKANKLFWDLCADSAIKERMAQLILTRCGEHVDCAKIDLAQHFCEDAFKLNDEAWKIIYELNGIQRAKELTACRVSKTVYELEKV